MVKFCEEKGFVDYKFTINVFKQRGSQIGKLPL